jgi:hypothetical protein
VFLFMTGAGVEEAHAGSGNSSSGSSGGSSSSSSSSGLTIAEPGAHSAEVAGRADSGTSWSDGVNKMNNLWTNFWNIVANLASKCGAALSSVLQPLFQSAKLDFSVITGTIAQFVTLVAGFFSAAARGFWWALRNGDVLTWAEIQTATTMLACVFLAMSGFLCLNHVYLAATGRNFAN